MDRKLHTMLSKNKITKNKNDLFYKIFLEIKIIIIVYKYKVN